MGKKIKKFLKKAAKAAIIGGAIYGATKLAKNRKKKALNAITAGDIASPKNYQIPDTDMGAISPESHYNASLDKSEYFAKGGRTGAKNGGLIKGKPKLAKRGWK